MFEILENIYRTTSKRCRQNGKQYRPCIKMFYKCWICKCQIKFTDILKHFRNTTLDLMPISSRKPNNSSHWYWNGQVRSIGLYLIQKSKCFGLHWCRDNSRVTQNLKVRDFIKSHYKQKNVFNSQSKDKIKSGNFRTLAMLNCLCDVINFLCKWPFLPKKIAVTEKILCHQIAVRMPFWRQKCRKNNVISHWRF